jgi:hypothetical protein
LISLEIERKVVSLSITAVVIPGEFRNVFWGLQDIGLPVEESRSTSKLILNLISLSLTMLEMEFGEFCNTFEFADSNSLAFLFLSAPEVSLKLPCVVLHLEFY